MMIRAYFSLPRCARNLRSLRKLKQHTGTLSGLKEYSVNANKEVAEVASVSVKDVLKGMGETETEIINEHEKKETSQETESDKTKGEKSLLLSALSRLRTEDDVTPVEVDGLTTEAEKQESLTTEAEKQESLTTEAEKQESLTTKAEKQEPKSIREKEPNYKNLSQQILEFLKKNPSKQQRKASEGKAARDYAFNQSYERALKAQAKINLSELIKLLKQMVLKKERSVDFLKEISSRILTESNLNIKECSDILYGMAALQYYDEDVLSKITEDISLAVDTCELSSVVGCILRSLGVLKYRNEVTLEILVEWIKSYKSICRRQDISSAIMALAVLNYKPEAAKELIEEYSQTLSLDEVSDSQSYLDAVWSLCVLDAVSNTQIDSVLSPRFFNMLQKNDRDGVSFSKAVKLLNINGYAANVMEGYNGALITNELKDVVPSPKNKANLTDSIIDALLNLVPSSGHVLTNVNSRYGFTIDAVFHVDPKGVPLPVMRKADDESGKKIAILSLGYFDMCRGGGQLPDGSTSLAGRILKAKGYRVLLAPHTEFGPSKRLIEKVQFLDKRIKELAAS